VPYLQPSEKKQSNAKNRGRAQSEKLRIINRGSDFHVLRTIMKRIITRTLAATAALFISAPLSVAGAADMALKAPPPAAPSVSWTGFYVGGNVGYRWSDPRTDAIGSGTGPAVNFGPGLGTFPFDFGFSDSHAARLRGAIGGIQVGYNYQFSRRWLLGLEADYQGSDQHETHSFVGQIAGPFCLSVAFPPPTCVGTVPFSTAAATGYETSIGWFGTVRGRAGILLTDQILLYGTGGLAYGRVGVSGTTSTASTAIFGIGGSVPFTPMSAAFNAAKTNVGYTVGGGVEGKFFSWLPANWSWKLEYIHLDLGSLNYSTPVGGIFTLVFPLPVSGTIAMHTRFNENIVRVGLNYKFGN
jgi:outer membrane immunogenic protein